MKEKFSSFWKDPVGSKIIANLIWAVIIAISALAYVFYQKISLSISFNEAWAGLLALLNKQRVIKNWYILYFVIIILLLLINRSAILKICILILKNIFSIRQYHYSHSFNFTNHGKRGAGPIFGSRSKNVFKIKPISNTKEWSLLILFSHNGDHLKSVETATEQVQLLKKFSMNQLDVISKNSKKEIIKGDTRVLLNNYEDQELILEFDFSYEDGGMIVIIKRHEKELLKTSVKYGCNAFRLVVEDCDYDFDLSVKYDRYE